ncbi:MAG: hypothetical protein Q8P67_28460 [archaeon]|nr:hypothetical protein [archaeon]
MEKCLRLPPEKIRPRVLPSRARFSAASKHSVSCATPSGSSRLSGVRACHSSNSTSSASINERVANSLFNNSTRKISSDAIQQ